MMMVHLDIHSIDLDRVRMYFGGVEQLAAEARTARDPQVVITALRVLAMQLGTVAKFVRDLAEEPDSNREAHE